MKGGQGWGRGSVTSDAGVMRYQTRVMHMGRLLSSTSSWSIYLASNKRSLCLSVCGAAYTCCWTATSQIRAPSGPDLVLHVDACLID